jgi:outer membrane protein OmpA-like peptidoglycan-associated protein
MISTVLKSFVRAAGTAGLLFACAGCGGSKPTNELLSARTAYKQAERSSAKQLVPDQLLAAQQALAAAEAAHEKEAGSSQEKTEAYIAERKARQAIAIGNIKAAQQRTAEAKRAYVAELEQERNRAEATLDQTRNRLEKSEQKLAAERAVQTRADQAARALQSLEEVATIKKDSRGLVITLSGAVLFKSAKSELLPTARAQLSKVAETLKQPVVDNAIVVEGYTDSRGSDRFNLELSRERAEVVRIFLIEQGLDPSRVSAVGKGKADPVADNSSPKGRANNRRVEIVLKNAEEKREILIR